jgi:replicative DNA helicase
MIDSGGEKESFNMKELSNLALDNLEKVMDSKRIGGTVGIPSGIADLDKQTGGFHNTNLIIIGARPGQGKTASCLSMAVNQARLGFKVGIVSIEMSPIELTQRVWSLISNVHATSFRDGNLSEVETSMLLSRGDEMSNLSIFLYDKSPCTVSDVAMQIKRWKMTTGIDIVYVDYLQRMKPEEKSESRSIAVGKFSSGLKQIAKHAKIPIVALAQLNRANAGKIPQQADLRDSGEIEQDADLILLLHRPGEYDDACPKDQAMIVMDKNRHGPIGIVRADWNGAIMKWSGTYNYE